jgi:urease accessory protein
MLEIRERQEGDAPATATLTLPFDLRQRSRLRATLDDGREVGLFLPRGTVLRGGDRLIAADGTVVEVRAADETVSTVRATPQSLIHAAYHLGNRHVPLQIGEGWLRYGHDHVLDDMVRGLGLEVSCEEAPFEPEGGAYGGGHSHGHGHSHSHSHSHEGDE